VRTRAAVARLGGDLQLAEATGVGRQTIARVLAELPVREGSCVLLEQRLADLDTPTPPTSRTA
jgi:hypothetical protein